MNPASCIIPEWPVPDTVHAYCTTRQGGYSKGSYSSFNLAEHVGDENTCVALNRQMLQRNLPTAPLWLQQVHGTTVIHSDEWQPHIEADACITDALCKVCAVMTADCLPVLFCNRQGNRIAAVHAGWRGLRDGILFSTGEKLGIKKTTEDNKWLVWIGPAIQQAVFEVGEEVRHAFCKRDNAARHSFKPSSRPGHWKMDMIDLTKRQLHSMGIYNIYGGQHCTYTDTENFFSHRRAARDNMETGRMATLIWIATESP